MSFSWRLILVLVSGVGLAVVSGPARTTLAAEDQPAKTAATPPEAEVAAAPEPTATAKYKLAFKFIPNQVVRYEVAQETEITTCINGDTEMARNSSKAKRHFTVIAADDVAGTADLELSIDWVRMVASFENPDRNDSEPVEFQSDDPKKRPKQFRDILDRVGKPQATIRFNAAGKIVEVLKGMLPPPPAAANQLSKGRPGSPLAMDGSPESYLLPLPDEPVAIGESWKERFDTLTRDSSKNPVKITIQRSYKLMDVKDGRAVIEFRTAVLTPITDPTIGAQLIQREILGKVVFDIERGLIESRDSGVDNTVINPFGTKGSMRAKSQYSERMLEDPAAPKTTASTSTNETSQQ